MAPGDHKKLPPYGKDAKPWEGLGAGINIYCGQRGWQLVKARGKSARLSTILYPGDRSPDDYHWPVRGLQVVVWGEPDVAEKRIGELVIALLQAGAEGVWLNDERFTPSREHFSRTEYLEAIALQTRKAAANG